MEAVAMDLAVLIIRLAVGLALAAHGAQKLLGAFGGPGLGGTANMFESLGFRPGMLFATVAGLGETAGGLLLALGLATPLASGVVAATMIVAIGGVHLQKGFFAQNGGYEYPLVIGLVAVATAFAGPGRLSLDAALGLSLAGTSWGLAALGLGVAGALPPLVAQRGSLRRTSMG